MIGIKNTRAVVLLGSLLLTLVVTGGLFAYAYTVASVTITTTATSADFASVTANATAATNLNYNLLGSTNGKIDEATIFSVQGDTAYNADVEVIVYLANADELVQEYRFWMMRVELTDGVMGSPTAVDKEGITKIISLQKPVTSFIVDSANVTSPATAYVHVLGGSWKSFPNLQYTTDSDPLIVCEVVQASAY